MRYALNQKITLVSMSVKAFSLHVTESERDRPPFLTTKTEMPDVSAR